MALPQQSPTGPPSARRARDVESVASASTPDRSARARTVQPQPQPPRPASHSQLPSQPPPQVRAHARQARAQRHSAAAAAAEPVKLHKMGSWVSGLFGEIQNLKGRERGGAVGVDGDKARG